MMKEMRAAYNPYNPERIRVPALAIYAVPKSADDLMRRGSSDRSPFPETHRHDSCRSGPSRTCREAVSIDSRARSRSTSSGSRRLLSEGVWWSSQATTISSSAIPREVLQQIEAFVSSLQRRP